MHVVILGNGITGATAALELRALRPEWRITMVSGETTYPYCRPALMYLFLGAMSYRDTKPWPDSLWSERRIELLRAWVDGIDTSAKELVLADGRRFPYDRLLLATGSRPNLFDWKGTDLAGVQGFYSLQDLHLLRRNLEGVERAVITGGGLIGVELAEMIRSRGIDVTILVREPAYWSNILPLEEARLVGRVIAEAGVELRFSTELDAILDDGRGRVCAAVTKDGEEIPCGFVGLTAGVSPNLSALGGCGIETGRGVLVDASFRTSCADVFAAGDCAEFRGLGPGGRNLIQQVWYTGKAQGALVARALAGLDAAYEPGIWFNSAKFFDLEYQVYGDVPPRPRDGVEHIYREDAGAHRALRLVFEDGRLIGADALGIRLRHEVFERWIRAGARRDEVLARIDEASFTPEFEAPAGHVLAGGREVL